MRIEENPPEKEETCRPLQALLVGLGVGLAERGQRRVEGPPFGLDQFGLDFLCRSRPHSHYIGRDAKASAGPLHLVIRLYGEPKVPFEKPSG